MRPVEPAIITGADPFPPDVLGFSQAFPDGHLETLARTYSGDTTADFTEGLGYLRSMSARFVALYVVSWSLAANAVTFSVRFDWSGTTSLQPWGSAPMGGAAVLQHADVAIQRVSTGSVLHPDKIIKLAGPIVGFPAYPYVLGVQSHVAAWLCLQ